MEYTKPHSKILYSYSLCILIAAALLITLVPHAVVNAYYLHWAVVGMIIMLMISPFGKIYLRASSKEKPQFHCWSWLIRLFLLQLSLIFIFLGIITVCFHWIPFTVFPNSTPPYVFSTFLQKDGLFPWAIYALYAARLGYISYVKNEDGYMSRVLFPFIKKNPKTLIGTAINLQARSAVFTVVSTTFAFMTLLIAVLVTPRSQLLLLGFHLKTIIIVMALIVIGFTPPFKKIVKKLLYQRIPLYISTLTSLIFFALFIWILNALLNAMGDPPIAIPRILGWLHRSNPLILFIIFSAAWWVGWTPLIASHFAQLSRGYQIRNVLLGTMLLPLIFTLLFTACPNILRGLQNYPLVVSIFSLMGFIYLLKIILEKTALPMLIRAYLPKRDQYKHRSHYFYFRKLFQMMLLVIYLYLPTGLLINIFLIFSLTLSFTLQIPLTLIASFYKFKKT